MGTFTWSYFVKSSASHLKNPYWSFWLPLSFWIEWSYQRQKTFKREMMKGQSRMFASHRARLPEGADCWKW
ncbi:hypothetical protein DdX_01722 [Ditylenchus destructor]|uniref:Uncharacterized protein n=1 Tax=Ditylenchus destructor TaxID=166010 RepID=A0AAD4NIM1_9BILA|nr:hypothetical protein DdX_01722 [Ditylenchus destructor]